MFFTLLLGYLAIWAVDRLREKPWKGALAVLALFGLSCLLKADYGWKGFFFVLLGYLLGEYPVAQLLGGISLLGWPAGVALAYLPLNLYNGQRGFIRGPVWKYLFYAFYPVHLTILWLLHRHFFGY